MYEVGPTTLPDGFTSRLLTRLPSYASSSSFSARDRSHHLQQLQGLSDLVDGLAEAEFERPPGMAYCPARRSLDDDISEILGLPNLGKL